VAALNPGDRAAACRVVASDQSGRNGWTPRGSSAQVAPAGIDRAGVYNDIVNAIEGNAVTLLAVRHHRQLGLDLG